MPAQGTLISVHGTKTLKCQKSCDFNLFSNYIYRSRYIYPGQVLALYGTHDHCKLVRISS